MENTLELDQYLFGILSLLYISYGVDRSLIVFSFQIKFVSLTVLCGWAGPASIPQRRQCTHVRLSKNYPHLFINFVAVAYAKK